VPAPRNLDKRRWWNREDLILLVLLGILLYLPGIYSIPLFDRDEPRFAVAARTMLQTGDYIVPRYNGMLRPDKPPLVYWLMDLGYSLTGGYSELGARLPSMVCSTLTLLVVYFFTGSRFGRITGMLAAVILGTSVLFVVEGRLATADATMVLFISICISCAWRAWDAGAAGKSGSAAGRLPRSDYLPDRSGERTTLVLDNLAPAGALGQPMSFAHAMLFWAALAAGTLTKGVPLVFVFIPMICLSLATGALPGQLRQWRSHFHLTSRRVALACVILALLAVYILASVSVGFFPEFRSWVTALGILLIAMALTPGLPEILTRCFWHGNWRWWRELRPLIGVPLLIVLVGWWVLWAGAATHWQLILDMVGNHFLNRVAGPLLHAMGLHIPDTTPGGTQDAMRTYGEPPGFYLAIIWGIFWPWSVLLIPAGFHTVRRLRGKGPVVIDSRPYQFLVAFIIPMWILLELSRGKLLHYPMPLFIPIAILCADTLTQSWDGLTDVLAAPWFESARWITLVIWLAMGLLLLYFARQHLDHELFWRCFPFGVALMATGFVSAFTWNRISWPLVLAPCWAGSLLVAGTLLLPSLPQLQVSPIAGQIMKYQREEHPQYKQGQCNYEDATLVFYSGANVKSFEPQTLIKQVPFAPAADPSTEPYLLAVDSKTLELLDQKGLHYTKLTRRDLPSDLRNIEAFAIPGLRGGSFKPVTVTVITNYFFPPDSPRTLPATLPTAPAP